MEASRPYSLLQIAKQAQETPDERAMMPAEVLPNEYE